MATGKSGYFDIAGDRGFTVRIHWAEEYEITTNKSTLNITSMQVQSTTWSYTWFPGGTISVDGTVVKEMSYMGYATHMVSATANSNWHEVKRANAGVHGADPYPWAAGEFTHNADGTKSVTFSVDLKLYGEPFSDGTAKPMPIVTGSKTITLTTIPRVSTLTVSNGTLGTTQTITVNRQADTFTHTITYTCGTASGTICTKSSTTSISWTPPTSLAAQNTTGTSVTITMKIETFSGSTSIGTKTYTLTHSIPSSVKPTVSMAVSDAKGYLAVFGGYIQNKSSCNVALTASGNQGSTIKSYSITCGSSSSTKSSATFDLPTSGQITITAKVTDSRGRTATATATIDVIEYDTPKVTTLSAFRTELNGGMNAAKIVFTASVTPLSNQNTVQYTIEYKPKDSSSWSQTVLDITDYAPKDVSTIVEDVDTSSSYDVRIAVKDYFGTIYSVVTTLSSQYALAHLDKKQNRIGLGKVAEGVNVLDIGLDTHFRGDVTMDMPLSIENGGLGVTTLEEAQELLGGNTKVTVVTTAGEDLNDYTTPGWYYFESTYTPTNIPAGSNGWLQVIDTPDHVHSWIKQIWYRSGTPGTNDQQTFVRTKINNNAWGAWAQYYTNRDITLTYNVYRTLAELGLSGQVTTQQVFEALPTKSCIVFSNSSSSASRLSDAPTNYCIVELRRDGNYGYARATQVASAMPVYYFGSFYGASDSSASGFSGWRPMNPQMALGTEYEVAEYHRQKRVYTKVVDMGTVTNGTVYTYHDSTVYPIRYAAYNNAGIALPLFMEPALNSTYKAWVDVNTNKITARFASGYSSLRIYCQIWYTKT